jgi:hypothetical protein
MNAPLDPAARLLAELGAAIAEHDPVPADLAERCRAAFAMRDFDAQLAELVADSWSDDEGLVGVRSATVLEPERLLTFQAGEIAVDVEVADDMVVGRIAPLFGKGIVETVSILAERRSSPVDERGRFVVEVPDGGPLFRLEFLLTDGEETRRIVTAWVRS